MFFCYPPARISGSAYTDLPTGICLPLVAHIWNHLLSRRDRITFQGDASSEVRFSPQMLANRHFTAQAGEGYALAWNQRTILMKCDEVTINMWPMPYATRRVLSA